MLYPQVVDEAVLVTPPGVDRHHEGVGIDILYYLVLHTVLVRGDRIVLPLTTIHRLV